VTTDPPTGQPLGVASGLGPHCLGTRVVVRHTLPGTGPSGGPALNDVLGVLVEWGDTTLTVRREDGSSVVVDRSTVVAGKPVPPRPPVRLRVPADVAERRAVDGWPPLERVALGGWLLRASGGFSARGNSALVVGDPGTPWDEAVARVLEFYGARDLAPRAQVVAGSPEEARLREAGWTSSPGYEVPVIFLLAGVAAVRRRLVEREDIEVRLDDRLTTEWLADDERALRFERPARAVLEGPEDVVFASVVEGCEVVAKGRASLSAQSDVWGGVTDVKVRESDRRRGLAGAVMGALLEWAAERGGTAAYLQVRADNDAALALYDRLGFVKHHRTWYLSPPA
jgi:ribosomal protein S18 acetylase RimI-like enzyme